jgi:hypothetical protein
MRHVLPYNPQGGEYMKSSNTFHAKSEKINFQTKQGSNIRTMLQQIVQNLVATVLAEIVIHILFK